LQVSRFRLPGARVAAAWRGGVLLFKVEKQAFHQANPGNDEVRIGGVLYQFGSIPRNFKQKPLTPAGNPGYSGGNCDPFGGDCQPDT